MFGLLTLTVCVPPSFPILETASIGEGAFEPLTTMIEITSGCAAESFMVTVWPEPTVGMRAYQTPVRRSNPVVVLVGPAIAIQAFPKLSDGVIVTPACEETHITITSPPELSKLAVVCDSRDVELM